MREWARDLMAEYNRAEALKTAALEPYDQMVEDVEPHGNES